MGLVLRCWRHKRIGIPGITCGLWRQQCEIFYGQLVGKKENIVCAPSSSMDHDEGFVSFFQLPACGDDVFGVHISEFFLGPGFVVSVEAG